MSLMNFSCLAMTKNQLFMGFTPDLQEERPLRTSQAYWSYIGVQRVHFV